MLQKETDEFLLHVQPLNPPTNEEPKNPFFHFEAVNISTNTRVASMMYEFKLV